MLQLIALFTTTFLLIYTFKKWKHYRCSYQLPGPTALPIIGNVLDLACKTEDILWKMHETTASYKHPMRVWFGPQLLIVLSHPQHVEKILMSYKFTQKEKTYEFLKDVLGNGLVTASGPKWKSHRKIIQPLITLKFIDHSMNVLQEKLDTCFTLLDEHVDAKTFDIHEILHLYAGNCLGEIIMGMQLNSQANDKDKSFVKAFEVASDLTVNRVTRPWFHPNFLYNLTADGIKFRELCKILQDFVKNAIESSKMRRVENFKDDTTCLPLIDQIGYYMDENPGEIDEEDYIFHIITLHVASADTIALITAITCVCFGMYPECLQKVHEEISTILGDVKRELTTNDVVKLKYMDMCVKEVMRLAPIGPYILRKTLQDVKIDNLLIPVDTGIIVPIFSIHRDPKYWSHPPTTFIPTTFYPKTAGPRGCIGKTLAVMALKLILAKILAQYSIEADGKMKDFKLMQDISVRPVHGCKVRLKRRRQRTTKEF